MLPPRKMDFLLFIFSLKMLMHILAIKMTWFIFLCTIFKFLAAVLQCNFTTNSRKINPSMNFQN